MTDYNAEEQDAIASIFSTMLKACTKDGGVKRAAGTKPPWYVDPSHEAALFSHLSKWKHGELRDADSGAHPLVHLAWRALAIAWQENRDVQVVRPPTDTETLVADSFHSGPIPPPRNQG